MIVQEQDRINNNNSNKVMQSMKDQVKMNQLLIFYLLVKAEKISLFKYKDKMYMNLKKLRNQAKECLLKVIDQIEFFNHHSLIFNLGLLTPRH